MFEIVAFYFFAVMSVGLFGVSVFSKNVLYAMSALAGGMIFISGLFFLLGAEFLGVVQIIVYTGAVMVLYAFSLMIFDASKDVKESKSNKLIYTMAFISFLLILFIVIAPSIALNSHINYVEITSFDNTEVLGMVLFTRYLLLFELVAIMLLVAMICAIILAHKDMIKKKEGEL